MAVIGYARVSTREQNTDAQEAELRAAGAQRVFVDHGVSSRLEHRPAWDACVDYLREGDVLVVRALDRLAGSERIAIDVIRDLGKRGVRLRSLTEPFLDVDGSTPMGEAIIGIMAVLAQLRVSTIRENVAHSSGLFVALIVDVVGPSSETLLNRVKLWGVDAVGGYLCQRDVACSAEAFCEESCVEACVTFLQELDEARIGDCSGGSGRVDVAVDARLATGGAGA